MNYTKGSFPVWDEEFDREHLIEIAKSDLRAFFITALVKARQEKIKLTAHQGNATTS